MRSSEIKDILVTIRGRKGSPLVIHQFGEKARKEIEMKQQKKAVKAKEARDPEAEFKAAMYIDEKGRECAPITAIKKSIISAATAFSKDLKKVAIRQAVFVDCVVEPGAMIVPIENHDGTEARGKIRTDAVTIGMGTRGLTYRPQYSEWQLRLKIEFNERLLSEEQLLALIDQAGWGVGICEGRPEKSSALGWGRFERVQLQ
jgi:hypothetical protein